VNTLRRGAITSMIIGVLWTMIVATSVAVVLSFTTGESARPALLGCLILGLLAGLVTLYVSQKYLVYAIVLVLCTLGMAAGLSPLVLAQSAPLSQKIMAILLLGFALAVSLEYMLREVAPGVLTRHIFEEAVIRFLMGFGYVFFTAIVLVPFYVMVMTSLKSQQALLKNPLDFSIDFSQGAALFRSYIELFGQFNFGQYLWTSFYVSVLTVFITLLFSVGLANLHRFFHDRAAQYHPRAHFDLSRYHHSSCLVYVAGLFQRFARRGRGSRIDGWLEPT